MNEALQGRLFNRFPGLFKNFINLPEGVTNSIYCRDGWFNIIFDMAFHMHGLAECNGLHFEFTQIKEKLGTLRIYYKVCYKEPRKATREEEFAIGYIVAGIISHAEFLASDTCEICGHNIHDMVDIGITKTGYIQTLCAGCYSREHRENPQYTKDWCKLAR